MGGISIRRGFLLALSLILSACASDNNSPNSSNPPDEGPKYKTQFLPFDVFTLEHGSRMGVELRAVDAKDSSRHVLVDSNDYGNITVFPELFQTGLYQESDFTIAHYHASHLIYSNAGRLMVAPIFDVVAPTPTQLSNATNLHMACLDDMRRGNDYRDQANSRFVYKIMEAVMDTCALHKGRWQMVRLSTNSNTPPVDLPASLDYIVDAIHDTQTAALIGWLVVDNGKLARYDVDFTERKAVMVNGAEIVVNNHARLLTRTKEKHFIITVDNHLYHYDPRPDKNQITSDHSGFSAPAGTFIHNGYIASDGDYLYFAVFPDTDTAANPEQVLPADIYRLAMTEGAVAQKLATEARGIALMTLTNGGVAYAADALKIAQFDYPVFTAIRRIDTQTFAIDTLSLPTNTVAIHTLRSEGTRLYASLLLGDSADPARDVHSLMIFEDGVSEPNRFDHFQLVGETYNPLLRPYRDSFNMNHLLYFQHDPVTNKRQLFSVSASGDAHITEIGVLPDNVNYQTADFAFTARGHNVGLFHIPTLGDGSYDLYFYDAVSAQSLHRVELSRKYHFTQRAVFHKANNRVSANAIAFGKLASSGRSAGSF